MVGGSVEPAPGMREDRFFTLDLAVGAGGGASVISVCLQQEQEENGIPTMQERWHL